MKATQKPQEVDIFTFPTALNVSLPVSHPGEDDGTKPLYVAAGDYLLIIDGALHVMSKKEFHAKHGLHSEPVSKLPRVRKLSVRKRTPKHGLGRRILNAESLRPRAATHPEPNGVEHEA